MALNQQVTTSLVLSWVSLTAASRWNASNPSLKHDVTQPAGNKTSSVSVVSLTTKDTFSSLCSQPPADAVPLTTPTSMMPLNQEVTTLIYMLNFLLAHTVKNLTDRTSLEGTGVFCGSQIVNLQYKYIPPPKKVKNKYDFALF